MSVEGMVKVGVAAAQAAIDVAADLGDDPHAVGLQAGTLEFLRLYSLEVDTDEQSDLLAAYRDWLQIAVTLYSTGDETKIREYMHRGAVLQAEMDLAEAGIAGELP